MVRKLRYCIPVITLCGGVLFYTSYKQNQVIQPEPVVAEKVETPEDILERDVIQEVAQDNTIENPQHIWELIEKHLGNSTIEGITMIDVIPGKLEKDSYERYFVACQVLGVDQQEDINMYDYYMMLQRNEKGEFIAMPLGIEVMKSEPYESKKELTTTMLKMANGWEMPHKEFQKKLAKNVEDIEKIEDVYHMQELIDFMRQYVESCANAIEIKQEDNLEKYYLEESELYKNQQEIFQILRDTEVEVELYNIEITRITCLEEDNLYEVTVKARVQTYEEEEINRGTQESIYRVKEDEKGFWIVGQKSIKQRDS